jgi:hypothetical protein
VKKKLLVLLATLALLVPAGSASAAPASQTESACLSQRSKLVQELSRDAVRTEPIVRAGRQGMRFGAVAFAVTP